MKDLLVTLSPKFLISFYHWLLALCGAILYGFPSRKLLVIGITGTNGKSTVVEMCHRILRGAGFQVASISSIRFKMNDEEWLNTLKMTMPGRFQLQKFIRKAVNAGCKYVVLEVTSEGIKQHRHRFIDFDVAVLTNLTPEHLESHGGFEKYKKAKGELFHVLIQNSKFKNKKVSIVNLDDPNAEYFLRFPADKKYGYTTKDLRFEIKDLRIVRAEEMHALSAGLTFRVNSTDFNLPLRGKFNVSNALAAICVGLSQDIDLQTIKKALEKMEGVPGRMELVVREPFIVIVDYAHTPDALEKVYRTIRASGLMLQGSGRMICVLGAAGGGRDKWKRPEMGKIAAEYCDQIILTNEDPYDEDPTSILEQIEVGYSQIQNPKSKIQNRYKILDRRQAIQKALSLAQPGDVVVITGKGCEPWMCVAGGRKIPWDDRQVVREELDART